MFADCRNYLLDKMKAVGYPSPFTSLKKLGLCKDSHVGAVLFETDEFARNGSKKFFKDQMGAQHKRRRVFDRGITFSAVFGDYDEDKVETTFEAFLLSLDEGLYIDGNYTGLEVVSADWVEKDDSILASKVSVQVKIKFDGGVYKDTDSKHITDIAVGDVEKEQEDSDGSN